MYIISKEFKNCKSPHDIEKKFLDIPNKEIYDKGYHSNKEIQQLLKNNTLSLVAKGYDKQSSKQEIEFAFNQALNKKEFKAYIDSIPGYTDYEKGYISNVELKNTKDRARKSLLQLGYSREHSEYIIRIKLDETQGKKDFLKAINNTPSKVMHNQGYKTVDEYNNLQHQYVTALKETSGYSHKQAIKFAKQEQENTNSKTHFMSLIKQIQPTQKY